MLSIPNGCASLSVDKNSQQALQLTTARYLQVSPANVTYMGCRSTIGQWDVTELSLSSDSQVLDNSISSVTANLRVQTSLSQSSLPGGDANQVFLELQQKIRVAVDSKNFTRSLITVSKALHANATIFTTVTGASASSLSVVAVQTLPTVAPMQAPQASTVVVSNEESTQSTSPSLPLIIGIVGGVLFLAICAGCLIYLLQIKRSASPPPCKESQILSEDEKSCDILLIIPGNE